MNELPPCCASCPELDGGSRRCRLLARPTLDARHRLLTMPCGVARLVRQRFRGHPSDVGQRALLSWVNPARSPEAIVQSYAELPVDARLWVTSWPLRELARVEPGSAHDTDDDTTGVDPRPRLPGERVDATIDALARHSLVDPVGAVMMIEATRGAYEPAAWRTALGAPDDRVDDHLVVAAFRHLCFSFDVLEGLPPEEAIALRVRRFSQGDLSDATALVTTRGAFARPDLTLVELRRMIASAIEAALVALSRHLGAPVMERVAPAFRRVLRVTEQKRPVDEAAHVLAALAPFFAEGRAALGVAASAGHVAGAAIASISDGASTTVDRRALLEHLALCGDARCVELARWEVGGVQSVKLDLSGPLSDPPPGPMPEPMGRVSPRLIQCRDVLWESFASMATATGRSVDDLVNDAMSRYRALHELTPEGASVASSAAQPAPSTTEVPAPVSDGTSGALSEAAIRARANEFDEDDITKSEGYRKLGPRTGVEARSIVFDLPPRSLPLSESSVPPPPDPTQPSGATAPPRSGGGGGGGRGENERDRAPESGPDERAQAGEIPFDLAPKSPTNRDTPLLGVAYALGDLGHVVDAAAVDPTEGVVPARPTESRSTELTESPANAPSGARLLAMAESFAQLDDEVGGNQRETTSPKMFSTPLQPPLFLEYLGRKYHVSHPRFIVGREKGSCHLLIADANVSRQHAVVEWNAGNYYMVDQGSTNGVGCGGHRIHRKQIVEGDRFEISGHILTFTFRLQ